jgi:hypothetical protein
MTPVINLSLDSRTLPITENLWKRLIAGVIDTGDKFVSGVVGTAEQFIPGVIDTADKYSFAIISANFKKKLKRYSEPQEILIQEKKLKSKISCQTPFKWLVVTNGRLGAVEETWINAYLPGEKVKTK